VIPTIAVRKISTFAVILMGTCLVPSLEAKDIIRDKSPDGKFALQITKEDKVGELRSSISKASETW